MQLKPAQLDAHLKRELKPMYVVAGEEPLLLQEALDAIRARARQEGYGERQVLEAERGFDWQRLVEACAALSLFSARRIVELQLPSGSPGDEGGRVLQRLAAEPPRDTLLLVVCGKLEGRVRSSAWYRAIETAGASVYAWPISREELPRWIESRARQAGLKLAAEAVAELVERTEGNLLAAAQDLEKLRLLSPSGQVGAEDIVAAVADSARFEAFDLSEKVLAGDAEATARTLQRLRDEGYEVPELVGALAYTFRQWAQAALHYARSRNAATALEAAGVWRTRQAAFAKALPRAAPGAVLSWLQALSRVDTLVKTGAGERAWEELLTCAVRAAGRPLLHGAPSPHESRSR